VSDVGAVHAHLEWLRSGDASDPEHHYGLQMHIAEEWMRGTGLSGREICEVVAAWLAYGFASGRLTFEFGDMIANDLNTFAQTDARTGQWFHTPFSWEVYLAFDAGEFSLTPGFDPVEGKTRPMINDIIQRAAALIEYPVALAEPGATPQGSA